MSQHHFGHIYIEPKPAPHGAFWVGAPREGFTAYCAAQCAVSIPADDVTAGETEVIQRRQEVLAALVGLQQAK